MNSTRMCGVGLSVFSNLNMLPISCSRSYIFNSSFSLVITSGNNFSLLAFITNTTMLLRREFLSIFTHLNLSNSTSLLVASNLSLVSLMMYRSSFLSSKVCCLFAFCMSSKSLSWFPSIAQDNKEN